MNKFIAKKKVDPSINKVGSLNSLILIVCLASTLAVIVASLIFYKDPRSKYDLVRPGRRELPETFYVQNSNSQDIQNKEDLQIKLQDLSEKLSGLDIYGEFNNDAFSDYKVFQEYLNEVAPGQ